MHHASKLCEHEKLRAMIECKTFPVLENIFLISKYLKAISWLWWEPNFYQSGVASAVMYAVIT